MALIPFIRVRRVNKKKENKQIKPDSFFGLSIVPTMKDKGARNEIRRYYKALNKRETHS